MYYFDNLMARAPLSEVKQTLAESYENEWFNPASIHRPSQNLLTKLHASYLDLVQFLGASHEDGLLFCNSHEESIAHVIQGIYFEEARPTGKNHFLCTSLEEAAIMLNLEKISSLGASHDLIEATPEGTIDLEHLHDSIQPRTQAICFSWANSLTGVIQPVEEITKICAERGVKLFVDASALAGLYETPLNGIDYLTYWGNPLGALSASALIWMKKGKHLPSLMPCGHDWMHSTTSHPAALMGIGVAAKLTLEQRERHLWHLMSLQEKFENTLKEKAGPITVLFENSQRLVHVSAIAFHGVHGELLAWHLNRNGVYATFGGGTRQQIHYLLKASHVPASLQHATLSFAFSPDMSLESVEQAAHLIADNVYMLRRMHQF